MTRAFLRCTVVLVLAMTAAIAPATAQFPPPPPTSAPPANAPPLAGTPKKKPTPPGPNIAGNWSGQLTQVDNQAPSKFELAVSAKGAETKHPDLDCTGKLTRVGSSKSYVFFTGYGADQHGLCSGFHDHRSVPVAVSMGALSLHQGGGEDAHVARSARQHPELRSHLERQAARRSRSRFADPRSRRHLRHGSRLRRLRAPLRLASGWRLLRYPRQVEPRCAPRLLGADGSGDRYHCRPDYRIGWLFYQQGLSRSSAPRPIQGCRIGKKAGGGIEKLRPSVGYRGIASE